MKSANTKIETITKPLIVGEEVELQILDLGYNGEGIAKQNGYVLFIENALPGEKCLVKIIKINKNFAYGELVEIIKPSSDRIEALCPYINTCGGCELQHLAYDKSLNFKQSCVKNALKKIAKIEANVLPCEKSDQIFNYRNKIAFCVGKESGKVCLGMHPKNSHEFVKIDNCVLAFKTHEKFIKTINAFFEEFKIKNYNFKTQEGLVRHVVLRQLNHKTLICIVINGEELPHIDELVKSLIETKEVFGLFICENKKGQSEIFGDKFKHIYGLKKLQDEEDGLIIDSGIEEFLQVNKDIKTKIYKAALLNIDKEDTVINAYSGAGVLTASLAKKCKFAIGIELNSESTKSANLLMESNNIKNMKNICDKVENVLDATVKSLKIDASKNLAIVLDPPRVGVDLQVILAIAKQTPKTIIYISCNPSTLARDIAKILEASKNSYELSYVKPFDMFPQTSHVETLAILKLKK